MKLKRLKLKRKGKQFNLFVQFCSNYDQRLALPFSLNYDYLGDESGWVVDFNFLFFTLRLIKP